MSMLKPYVSRKGDDLTRPPLQPIVLEDGSVEFFVERVLMHRETRKGRRILREFLVKWEGYGPEHNSWEPEANLLDNDYYLEYQGLIAERPFTATRQPSGKRQRRR